MDDKNENLNEDEFVIDEPEEEEELVMEDGDEIESSVKKLKEKIKKLESEKREYLDGWQRVKADMVNLKKQHVDEKKMFTQIGKESLLSEIIPVLDNFDAAFLNKKAWEQTPETWRVGIEYIYSQFLKILEDNGVERYGKNGEEFDASIHQPLEVEETEDESLDNKISQVIQAGYKIGDRVVREAKVKITQKK